MTDDTTTPAAPALPSHVKLAAAWGDYTAGQIVVADVDLLATLDVEGVTYRAATAQERAIAGFVD